MPEGPEIRRMVDGIAKSIEGEIADWVQFGQPELQHWEDCLGGLKVQSVQALGKAVLIHFADASGFGWTVYSHNQLYGKWMMGSAGRLPKTNRQLRFVVVSGDKAARLYSASDIRVLPSDQLDSIPYLARLGPDILNQPIDVDAIASQIRHPTFAGRALGGLLLDQAFIAGIGNYLRSEILFVAKLHPSQRPKTLSDSQVQTLAQTTYDLMWQAYRQKGVTNDLAREQALKAKGVRFGARRHHVFVRANQPCYACGSDILKETVNSRRLYRCPSCQPDPS